MLKFKIGDRVFLDDARGRSEGRVVGHWSEGFFVKWDSGALERCAGDELTELTADTPAYSGGHVKDREAQEGDRV